MKKIHLLLGLGLLILALPARAADTANLLIDPGFEARDAAWKNVGGNRYTVVIGAGRSGEACLRYQKEREADPAARENTHYDQETTVTPKTFYVASAWFKGDGTLRPSLRVASLDWQTLAFAQADPSREWREVRVRFFSGNQTQVRFQIFGGSVSDARESAPGASFCDDVSLRPLTEAERQELQQARVTVDAGKIRRRINPLFFGTNALFSAEDDASRADGKIARYLKEMPCRLLRYPGGEMADNYHWKSHRLDDPKVWPAKEGPQTMDTDEFMAWCRQIGAEPIFVVNLESSALCGDPEAGIKEAAAWVDYCNRQKGYHVRYWEIGNETYLKGTRFPMTARQYAAAFVKYARAMKAVDPAIRCGAVGPNGIGEVAAPDREAGSRDPWWPTVISLAGADLDMAVVHRYYNVKDYDEVAWNGINVGQPVAALRRLLQERLPGREILVALTEWNTWRDGPRGMAHALLTAEMIGDYLEGGVDLANYWPLRLSGDGNSFRSLMTYQGNEPLEPYQVLKLYSSRIGAELLSSESANVQVIPCASLSADQKRLILFLLNKSSAKEGMTVDLALKGFQPAGGSALALTAPGLDSPNLSEHALPVTARGGAWTCQLPPQSITVIELTR